MPQLHGGRIVARALKAEGVEAIFTLTGGHIVPILDGCAAEGIRIVDVRHEQSAAHAAEAWTRLTGRLGVAVVTAGPGVTDTITAVASAWQASAPMLVIGGRHLLSQDGMGGLQEMDHTALFRPITRWAGTGWSMPRLAETVAGAAREAFAGRGGPVFLDIPMDVLMARVDEADVSWPVDYRPLSLPAADAATLACIQGALAAAQRPVIFAGCGLVGGEAALASLAEALGAPVYLNARARGSLPPGHPLLGVNARAEAFRRTDLVLALGVDWDFRAGYGRRIHADATVIHVDREAARIGWNRPVAIGVAADPATVLAQLAGNTNGLTARSDWAAEMAALEQAASAAAAAIADDDQAPVHPQRFAREVAAFFGDEAIIAVDGGDIVSSTARWLRTGAQGQLLDPGPFGALGTGPGFALAAAVACPQRTVGIVFGDGGFGFNGMEYDTFIRHGLPIIGVLGNDGLWNNIRTWHKANFPDHLVATELGIQRYDRVVAAMGGHGEFVERPQDLRPALDRARASGLPALVNVHIRETERQSSNYG